MVYVLYGLLAVVIIIGGLYWLLRARATALLGILDRSRTNDRTTLPPEYELPRYYVLNDSGQVDTSARWPGWDGWYFFVLPDDRDIPTRMVRGSLMTGTYGLGGIDDYEKILLRLSTFDVAEHLCLVPTEQQVEGEPRKQNFLSQHYQPK